MLFLTMLASAMWYEKLANPDDKELLWTLQIGPFTLNYTQLYVGMMSSLIAFVPSLIVVSIFRHRRFRGEPSKRVLFNKSDILNGRCELQDHIEMVEQDMTKPSQTDAKTSNNNTVISEKATHTSDVVNQQKRVRFASVTKTSKSVVRKSILIPWWTIFIAYFILALCVLTGGSFTFFYSLQFGKQKTNNWFLSFFFGTAGSILFLEPMKVHFLIQNYK